MRHADSTTLNASPAGTLLLVSRHLGLAGSRTILFPIWKTNRQLQRLGLQLGFPLWNSSAWTPSRKPGCFSGRGVEKSSSVKPPAMSARILSATSIMDLPKQPQCQINGHYVSLMTPLVFVAAECIRNGPYYGLLMFAKQQAFLMHPAGFLRPAELNRCVLF